MYSFAEKAINEALASRFAHGAPFSDKECKDTKSLVLSGVKELSELEPFENLESLDIRCSDLTRLGENLAELKKLVSLSVNACPLSSLDELQSLTNLEELNLVFTNVQSISVLKSFPKLRRGLIIGNPLNPFDYDETIPSLLELNTNTNDISPLLLISSKEDSDFTRRLQFECNLPLCYGTLNGFDHFIVRPGLAKFTNRNCDFISQYSVRKLLAWYKRKKGKLDVATFFERIADSSNAESLSFETNLRLGNSTTALKWIDLSPIDDKCKDRYRLFIKGFPNFPFYQTAKENLQACARALDLTLPQWFIEAQRSLTFLLPFQELWFQFDDSTQKEFDLCDWYKLDWLEDGCSQLFEEANAKRRPFVIASSEYGGSHLAINYLDTNGFHICEYDLDKLGDENYYTSFDDALTRVFPSYGHMLSHIEKIKVHLGKKEFIIFRSDLSSPEQSANKSKASSSSS